MLGWFAIAKLPWKWFFPVVIILTFLAVRDSNLSFNADSDSPEVAESYLACGCGGCGGEDNFVVKEVSSKEYFEERKDLDLALKNNSGLCATAGCSICTKYVLVKA